MPTPFEDKNFFITFRIIGFEQNRTRIHSRDLAAEILSPFQSKTKPLSSPIFNHSFVWAVTKYFSTPLDRSDETHLNSNSSVSV